MSHPNLTPNSDKSTRIKKRKLHFHHDSVNTSILFSLVFVLCIDFAFCGQTSSSGGVSGLGKASSPSKDTTNRSGGSGSSSPDDSESSSHHYHRHHRHHPHPGSPASSKSLPQSNPSLYPSTATGNNGYLDYSTNSGGATPLSYLDPYYDGRHYERPSREFSARSTSYPAMVAASSSQVGFADTDYGGLALATGHGGGGHGGSGGHGHDGGGGYGHGHGHTTYYKTVNKVDQSSLGLLGLLGLLSLLSNVLMLLTTTAMSTTMMMMGGRTGRKQRDTVMLIKMEDQDNVQMERKSVIERLSHLILPSLNLVGHAKDGKIPLNCTYQEVCKTNRVLIQLFGADEGRPVAAVMSTAITKMLADNSNKQVWSKTGDESGRVDERIVFPIEKHLNQAALAGRNGKNCEIVYPTCEALSDDDLDHDQAQIRFPSVSTRIKKKSGSVQLPLLISPERATAIILGQK